MIQVALSLLFLPFLSAAVTLCFYASMVTLPLYYLWLLWVGFLHFRHLLLVEREIQYLRGAPMVFFVYLAVEFWFSC